MNIAFYRKKGRIVESTGTHARRVLVAGIATPVLLGPTDAHAFQTQQSAPNVLNACPDFSFPTRPNVPTSEIAASRAQDGSIYYTNGVYAYNGGPKENHHLYDTFNDLMGKIRMTARVVNKETVDIGVTAFGIKGLEIKLFRRELNGKTKPEQTDLTKRKSISILRAGIPPKGIVLCASVQGTLDGRWRFEWKTPSFKVKTEELFGTPKLSVNDGPTPHTSDVKIPGAEGVYFHKGNRQLSSYLFRAPDGKVFTPDGTRDEKYQPLNPEKRGGAQSTAMHWYTKETHGLVLEQTALSLT